MEVAEKTICSNEDFEALCETLGVEDFVSFVLELRRLKTRNDLLPEESSDPQRVALRKVLDGLGDLDHESIPAVLNAAAAYYEVQDLRLKRSEDIPF